MAGSAALAGGASAAGTPPAPSGARGFGPERLVWCLAASLLWAAPHAGLSGASPGIGALGYLALAGAGSFTLGLAALGWGSTGTDPAARRQSASLTLGLGLALLPCCLFAHGLMAATHHRPLGATTFAFGAATLGAAGVLVASWALRQVGRGRRVVVWALSLAAAVSALALCVVAAGDLLRAAALRSAVGDFAFGGLLLLAVLLLPAGRWARRSAPAVAMACLAFWAATFWLVSVEPEVRARVKSVPVVAGVLGLAVR